MPEQELEEELRPVGTVNVLGEGRQFMPARLGEQAAAPDEISPPPVLSGRSPVKERSWSRINVAPSPCLQNPRFSNCSMMAMRKSS
jgi:hypothetical protein